MSGARLGHAAIDRRRPPTNGVLDQASDPAFAYKCTGVVLAAAINDNDLRRCWSQDSEYAKQPRHDGCLVQGGDDDRHVIIRSGRIVSGIVRARRLHARSRSELHLSHYEATERDRKQ